MGKKILLADDSITIQKVIELTFSDEDFEVVTVGNGRLAIERVQDVRPDIVLCDIIMPEKDGYEVCDFVKKHPALSQIPVLLLTGAFEPFDQERAVRVGSDGFLAKPFEPQTLIAKVKELLNQAAARAGAGRPAAAPVAPSAPAAAPPAYTPAAMYTTPPVPPAAPAVAPPVPAAPPAPAAPTWSVASPSPVVFEPEPIAELEPEPPSAPSWPRPAMPPAEPAEVSFISDEPYSSHDLSAAAASVPPPSFAAFEPEATFEAEAFEPIPSAAPPAAAPADDDMFVPEPVTQMEELMEVAPEEAASLSAEPLAPAPPSPPPSVPPAPVMVTPPGGWIEQTVEVSLAERAQASAAAQAQAEAEAESERFEEVFDSDTTPVPPATSRMDATPDVFSRFEPEFTAPPAKSKTPEPMAPPTFEPEFDDSSTVVFKATPAPAAPVPPPAPPVPAAKAAPVEEPAFAPEPPSLNTFLASVMDPKHLRPTPAPAPVAPPPPPAPEPEPEPEPEPAPEPKAAAWEPVANVVADLQEEVSFSDLSAAEPEAPAVHSAAAEVPVPVEMVSQIAQRVIAQISDKVVREIAWEVIPDLAEAMIKKEIERLKAELEKV